MLIYNQMVVRSLPGEPLDRVFQALADPTRRDILRRCAREGRSVSGLAREYPMSFAAVQKHVAVLHRAGLVRKERSGREQRVTTAADSVRGAQRMLEELQSVWRGRVDQMTGLLADDPSGADPIKQGSDPGERPGRQERSSR